ncbi:MAG: hypothetical protein PHN31_03255 [Candidatus Gracilibacteria bacterium]|nr:hypothetical protein [Candidatus Gracilibacteria bacterium]
MEIKGTKLYNLYLGIVSFVSIIAIGINLGIVLTSIGNYFLISNEEYLQYRENYRLENCKNPTTSPEYDKNGNITKQAQKPTEEEIQKCEAKAREDVKLARSYDLKDMFITSGAWFIVFLMFFLFHYPKFVKAKKED